MKDLKELTDKDLAALWRKQVNESRKLSQELLDRGYGFRCTPHGNRLSFHNADEIIISKEEMIIL